MKIQRSAAKRCYKPKYHVHHVNKNCSLQLQLAASVSRVTVDIYARKHCQNGDPEYAARLTHQHVGT